MKLSANVSMNLAKLIESRLLIQANSGGGKSWAIRRIIEQAFGKVQIIVIDPEGEFANMRSEYDFAYAGKGGDAAAESRSAALLAQRLLELKASAIIDLYELPPQERKHFVRVFCESLVNAPKELWHEVLVIIDEAHVFAPEKDQSESLGAVVDLASRGRKRGFCAVLATQRPAKLNKDAAAECNNKLIGRAVLDIDQKRAADELGFTAKDQIRSLRNLSPGEFYVFGPAVDARNSENEVVKTTIGDVKVKPPKRGVAKAAPPKPTEKIKEILAKLADLPQEAEKKLQTEKELRAEIHKLNHTIRSRDMLKAGEPVKVKTVTQTIPDPKAIKAAVDARDRAWKVKMDEGNRDIKRLVVTLTKVRHALGDTVNTEAMYPVMEAPESALPTPDGKPLYSPEHPPEMRKMLMSEEPYRPRSENVQMVKRAQGEEMGILSRPRQKILDVLAWLGSAQIDTPSKVQVAALCSVSPTSGTYANNLGALRTAGYVDYPAPNAVSLTDKGREAAQVPQGPLDGTYVQQGVRAVISEPQRTILDTLIDIHPDAMRKEDLALQIGVSPTSGTYANNLGALRTRGFVDYPQSGMVRATDIFFI